MQRRTGGHRAAFGLVAVLLLLAGGCAAPPVRTSAHSPGTILLLPVRDAVQGGREHPAGAGSGRLLAEQLQRRLARGGYRVVFSDDPAFTATAVAPREAALAEARRLGADYCLQLALGEFLDAAPLTFRTDALVLQQGVMARAGTGEVVWELTGPLLVEKGNLTGYRSLVRRLAAVVAASVAR
jgi:hypothetical protein